MPDNKTIVVPMNMQEPPKGFEYTGEYGTPQTGEYYLEDDGTASFAHKPFNHVRSVILRQKRWRANKGETYWLVRGDGVVCSSSEDNMQIDSDLWTTGNYYRTEELAEQSAKRVIAAYKGEEE